MTKYVEGSIVKTKSGVSLVVRKKVCKKTCTYDCYFGKYIDSSNYYCRVVLYVHELNEDDQCESVIPEGCCFKILKGGI